MRKIMYIHKYIYVYIYVYTYIYIYTHWSIQYWHIEYNYIGLLCLVLATLS
jgi:hypothetical protein